MIYIGVNFREVKVKMYKWWVLELVGLVFLFVIRGESERKLCFVRDENVYVGFLGYCFVGELGNGI